MVCNFDGFRQGIPDSSKLEEQSISKASGCSRNCTIDSTYVCGIPLGMCNFLSENVSMI